MAGRKKRSGRRFIQLWTNVKRSGAFHGLSVYGRCALIEIMDRFSGANNGLISLSVRECADELNCNKDTAARALREVDDSGLAHPLTSGTWRGKRAVEWRLTFHRCDKTGELPILNWAVRSDRTQCPTKPDTSNTTVRPDRTHKPKSPINGKARCPTKPDTYRCNQGDSDTTARTAKARKRAGLGPLA
jgi:hypothetical protein